MVSAANGADLRKRVRAFNASYSNPTNFDATSVRIDQMVRNKLILFGRYNQSHLLKVRCAALAGLLR